MASSRLNSGVNTICPSTSSTIPLWRGMPNLDVNGDLNVATGRMVISPDWFSVIYLVNYSSFAVCPSFWSLPSALSLLVCSFGFLPSGLFPRPSPFGAVPSDFFLLVCSFGFLPSGLFLRISSFWSLPSALSLLVCSFGFSSFWSVPSDFFLLVCSFGSLPSGLFLRIFFLLVCSFGSPPVWQYLP